MKLSALDPLRDESTATGAKIGKGCIRYTRPEWVNLEALARLLQATAMVAGRFEDRGRK